MKKHLTAALSLFLVLLVFAGCALTGAQEGTIIGTENGNNIYMKYYDKFFPAETTAENTTANNTTAGTDYDLDSAVFMDILTPILQTAGQASVDKQKLNTAINNLKGQYGDTYLAEAEKKYQLPIKTEQDLIYAINFSLLYANYLERIANITNEQISKTYYESYKTKYCASHILVENEQEAQTLLNHISDGSKTFDDYTVEAEYLAKEQEAQQQQQAGTQQNLTVNDVTISGVKVKQFADLGCAPASNYVGEFANALTHMQKGTISTAPVKTEFGYHIIDLRDIEETDLTREVQNTIKSSLLSSKQQTAGFSSYYVKQLLDQVTLEITDEKVKSIFDKKIKELTEDAANYKPETEETTTNN